MQQCLSGFWAVVVVFQSALPKRGPKLQALPQQTGSSTGLLRKECEQADPSARQAVLLGTAVLCLRSSTGGTRCVLMDGSWKGTLERKVLLQASSQQGRKMGQDRACSAL